MTPGRAPVREPKAKPALNASKPAMFSAGSASVVEGRRTASNSPPTSTSSSKNVAVRNDAAPPASEPNPKTRQSAGAVSHLHSVAS
jgi:hypothetical protein